MKRLIAIALLSGFALGLAGCNTIHGAGEDVQKGGQAIQGAADRNK